MSKYYLSKIKTFIIFDSIFKVRKIYLKTSLPKLYYDGRNIFPKILI